MNEVRSLVLTGFGINCEEEMAAAYRQAGAEVDIVHLKDIFLERVSLFDYDVINFPGGFSFGDNLGAGRVLANRLKYKQLVSGETFLGQLLQCRDQGKFIIGICNGFQVLVALGLLPGLKNDYFQHAALVSNDSGHFENRWCHCIVPVDTATPLLPAGAIIDLPVRHAEGKLQIHDTSVQEEIITKGLIALQYTNDRGQPTVGYPQNPNGSWMNCAALTDPSGQVLGMMPHPEAFLSGIHHPKWGQMRREGILPIEGQGLFLFKYMVTKISELKNSKQKVTPCEAI